MMLSSRFPLSKDLMLCSNVNLVGYIPPDAYCLIDIVD